MDEEASDQDVMEAIAARVGTSATFPLSLSSRNTNRGNENSYCFPPSKPSFQTDGGQPANCVYVNCRVRTAIIVKKCFKCQGYGHVWEDCTGPKRRDHCWRCGVAGHKNTACKSSPKCMLCDNTTSSDHFLGSFKCNALKRAHEAAKKKK